MSKVSTDEAPSLSKPQPAVSADPVRQRAISFADWTVLEKAVASSRGIIPLDQVSCCTYDAELRNIWKIAIGAVIALAGMFVLTKEPRAGLVLLVVGGIILIVSLRAKRSFRLYATSGYFFEVNSQEMDVGGDRILEFEAFNAALVEYRHRYISTLRS